jgi:hypothetical protein
MTRLQNEKLHILFSSPGITGIIKLRMMTLAEYVAHVGVARNVYKISIRKHDEKRPLGRPTYRQEDNIKMCLKIYVMMWTGF